MCLVLGKSLCILGEAVSLPSVEINVYFSKSNLVFSKCVSSNNITLRRILLQGRFLTGRTPPGVSFLSGYLSADPR